MRNEYSDAAAREHLSAYVRNAGGLREAAARLRIPYSTLAGVCNGNRGIGTKLALRMAAADPLLDAQRLVWVRPTKCDSEAA